MKLHILAVLVIALSIVSAGQNTATLSTNLSFLTSNPATGNVEMKLVLVNCGQNNPRVISSWMIMSPPPPFRPDSTGHVSGTIIGNDKIDCGGTQAAPITPTLYAISYFVNNAQVGPTKMYNVLAGTTFDPTTATPSNPGPVPAPTWDGTYLRLDGVSPLGQATGGQVPQFDATVGMYRPMTVGGFNLHSPGPIGDVTPGPGQFTSVNNELNATTFAGSDIGAKVNAAAATCSGTVAQCKIKIPPQSAQLSFSTGIVLGGNTTLECSRGGQISSGSPSITNQLLNYTGTGRAVTLNGSGSRLIGCDLLLGAASAEGVRVTGISDHVIDSGFYGGGVSTILAHVTGSGDAEDNHIEQSRFSAFIGIGIQVDNTNDTLLEHNTMYGVPSNTTGRSIVIDSNAGGTIINDIPGGYSGLHGLVVQRTLGGNFPSWIFANNFECDLSSSDCILFDSSLGSANIGATFINSWAAGATGNGINIAGGSMITITGGTKLRVNGKSGISVSTTGHDITISDNEILANNQSNAGYSGIDVSNHPGAMLVTGNHIGNYPEVGGYQQYAINAASDIEGLAFSNNNCSHNVVGCFNLSAVTASKLTYLGNVDNGGTMPADYVSGAITINGLLTWNNGAVAAGNIKGNAGNSVNVQGGVGSTQDFIVRNAADTFTRFAVADNGDVSVPGNLGMGGNLTAAGLYVAGSTPVQLTNAAGFIQNSALVVPVKVTTGSPTIGQAACIYAAGPPVQIGNCTSVVGATGACTCAP